MICKTIKVGKGMGPIINCSRYTKIALHVNGLTNGEIIFHVGDTAHSYMTADGIREFEDIDSIQVEANTKACVIVKLTAEVVCLTPQ